MLVPRHILDLEAERKTWAQSVYDMYTTSSLTDTILVSEHLQNRGCGCMWSKSPNEDITSRAHIIPIISPLKV